MAGLDRYLPDGFARIHPRWGTPWVALVSQALITGVFVFLGQAGTSVRGAYDALVSMTIIWYFIPFLYLFAAAIKLRAEARVPGFRIPGGSRGVAVLGVGGTRDDASPRSPSRSFRRTRSRTRSSPSRRSWASRS